MFTFQEHVGGIRYTYQIDYVNIASVSVLGWGSEIKDGTVVGGQRRGKFGKFSHSGRVTGKLSTCIIHDSCKTGSAYTGCVVNGRIAGAAS